MHELRDAEDAAGEMLAGQMSCTSARGPILAFNGLWLRLFLVLVVCIRPQCLLNNLMSYRGDRGCCHMGKLSQNMYISNYRF